MDDTDKAALREPVRAEILAIVGDELLQNVRGVGPSALRRTEK